MSTAIFLSSMAVGLPVDHLTWKEKTMMLHPTLERIRMLKIVPVVAIDRVGDAIPLARALSNGGLPCAEITFRTDAAERSIESIAQSFPDMALGAGTVLTVDQAQRAVNAGAKYIVSPGLSEEVVRFCQSKDIPITPGIMTPTEIEHAIRLGLGVVKFFPAEAAGGAAFLKAVSAPYKSMLFIPTGGVSEKNLKQYLDIPSVLACGGSWMVKQEMIASGDFGTIESLTRSAVALAGA